MSFVRKISLLFLALLVSIYGHAQHIDRIAGDSIAGFSGDGSLARAARLNAPSSVAIGKAGNIYIVDQGNNRIRQIDHSGIITTIAGGGVGSPSTGDTATHVALGNLFGIASDSAENIYFTEGDRVFKLDAQAHVLMVIAGSSSGYSGDSSAAVAAQLSGPLGLCLDEARNILYIADEGNARIRKVDLVSGVITTVAGSGNYTLSGDGGPAANAGIDPNGIAIDSSGNLYISDGNNRIRYVDRQSGMINTFAGTTQGYAGDGGAATSAQLFAPFSVVFDKNCTGLYFAEYGNNVIRKIDMSAGIIQTVVGGPNAWIGNGGPAAAATLAEPTGVDISSKGDIILTDQDHNQIRKVFVSQTGLYHPFPDSNAVWNFHLNTLCMTGGPYDYDYSIKFGGDTIISGRSYHKLFTPAVMPNGPGACYGGYAGCRGAVRQDTTHRKVYIVPRTDTTERLLYDFNLYVGDTVRGYLEVDPWLGSKDYVHSIDSVLVGNSYRKRWHINNTYGIDLIEGIGSTYGLIEQSLGEIADGSLRWLTCFQQNGQTIYPDTNTVCDLITGINEPTTPENLIRIFPNPANKDIYIDGGTSMISLYSVHGNEIVSTHRHQLDVSDLANGFYWLECKTENGLIRKKIVISH